MHSLCSGKGLILSCTSLNPIDLALDSVLFYNVLKVNLISFIEFVFVN